MQWESRYKQIFPDAVWTKLAEEGHDTNLFMWCDENTLNAVNKSNGTRNVVFIRRYEFFSDVIERMDWGRVSDVIMVNDYLAMLFQKRTGIKPYVVYNGVDPANWTFQNRTHGNKIAWVGYINLKKNLQLALQVMSGLPTDYELHIAGGLQDAQVMVYIENLVISTKNKIVLYGQIPSEHMNSWLDDKNYILSTAISEGCPNHVIEAMAKGIKPVVHNWAGAKEQFGDYVFNTTDEAVHMIAGHDNYDSQRYIDIVNDKFGLSNYDKVKEIVCVV